MIGMLLDFSSEAMKPRHWKNIYKVLKEKSGQHRILCPAKISIRINKDSEMKENYENSSAAD